MTESSVHLPIPSDSLRPLISAVVRETIAALSDARQAVPEHRLTYSEAEAASLLGLNPHQLRDERLRGRIQASKIVGGRIAYLRDDLVNYVMGRRIQATES